METIIYIVTNGNTNINISEVAKLTAKEIGIKDYQYLKIDSENEPVVFFKGDNLEPAFVIDLDSKRDNYIDNLIHDLRRKEIDYYTYDKEFNFVQFNSLIIDEDDYEEFLDFYAKGFSPKYITELLYDEYQNHNVNFNYLMKTIISREVNKSNKRLSEKIKEVIARRDSNNVMRKSIAEEINVSFKTIQRACEKYGNTCKDIERTKDEDICELVCTEVEYKNNNVVCPKCNHETNRIDEGWSNNSYFCVDCLEEYHIKSINGVKGCYRVRWEYIN